MFETFEDKGTYYVKGSVFVIAIIKRDTLQLIDYVDIAFMSKEEAEDYGFHEDQNDALAYIVQEREVMVPIHGEGYESKA
jgi:hypothetical protein